MDRKTFKRALDKENCKRGNFDTMWNERFFFLNEVQESILDKTQIEEKGKMISKLHENQSMMEDYYLYHICRMYNSKWKSATPEDLVNHWYKNSELIKSIYENKQGVRA